jgi:hypothetical protein
MSNVEFNEGVDMDTFTSRRILGEETTPGMGKLLTEAGLAKDDNQAKYILFGIAGVSFILAILITLYVFLGGKNNVSGVPPKSAMPADHPPFTTASS